MTLTEYTHLEQGTEEWLEARRGVLTASVVGNLISVGSLGAIDYDCTSCRAVVGAACVSKAKRKDETPAPIKTFHPDRIATAEHNKHTSPPVLTVADNDTTRSITAQLVAERITGFVEPSWTSADMQRGHDVEPIARDWYADFYEAPVKELGFMVREFPSGARLGWSPDGLIAGNASIEIKAPRAKKHLLTILSGEVPPEHMAQCQAGLLVSGRKWMDFCSYFGGMKPFVKRVHADEQWFDVITKAVENFETKATQMQAQYDHATSELPNTERLTFDMEMVI